MTSATRFSASAGAARAATATSTATMNVAGPRRQRMAMLPPDANPGRAYANGRAAQWQACAGGSPIASAEAGGYRDRVHFGSSGDRQRGSRRPRHGEQNQHENQ